jgi:hypothetical protein
METKLDEIGRESRMAVLLQEFMGRLWENRRRRGSGGIKVPEEITDIAV